jgi:hypothetical protein
VENLYNSDKRKRAVIATTASIIFFNYICLSIIFKGMTKFKLGSLFLFVVYSLQGQQYTPDSVLTTSSLEFAKHIYHTQRGGESAIYNGIKHEGYPSVIEGHAYFQSPDWQKGSVVYDNFLYEDIVMKYDLLKDHLIITPNISGGIPVTLFDSRVAQFSFSTFNFIRIDKKEKNASLAPGFYQQLVHGKITAILKKTKSISEKITGTTFIRKFEERAKYYLLKDGITYPVKKKKDFLAAVKIPEKPRRNNSCCCGIL